MINACILLLKLTFFLNCYLSNLSACWPSLAIFLSQEGAEASSSTRYRNNMADKGLLLFCFRIREVVKSKYCRSLLTVHFPPPLRVFSLIFLWIRHSLYFRHKNSTIQANIHDFVSVCVCQRKIEPMLQRERGRDCSPNEWLLWLKAFVATSCIPVATWFTYINDLNIWFR